MRKLLIPALLSLVFACKQDKSRTAAFLSPEEGQNITVGQAVTLQLDIEQGSFDSIRYLVDTTYITTKTTVDPVQLPTGGMQLGARLLTAQVYKGGAAQEVTSNILLLPANAPAQYGYSVVNTYPHDTTSYTQGLEYHDGVFYESDGENGGSSLRKVEVQTGKVLKKVDLPAIIFAEGLTVVGDRIIQLTWKNGIGFIYDKNTFKKLGEFSYQASQEGWGLAFDGTQIWKSDGSNRLYKLNKETYKEEGFIEVYDTNGAVEQLNELEFIDGKLYANVYQTDKIVIINPQSGAVEGVVDLKGILPDSERVEGITDVLNGIAFDPAGKRLFVTGKKWSKLFQIKLAQQAIASN
ncbi:glutaminyl-peptide cyclotransferase [Pedobacter sp. SYSU D00535]|uniref:glutaminyl-peptide cyclotransferase n=1 Tax=Pedobacter sp. SYSU D00535 TaxID=2810308 RepID=UPI001A971369|nr:glutaminyl-peptide cyclotransferase [Pedobacter sp. SYSU D00535]